MNFKSENLNPICMELNELTHPMYFKVMQSYDYFRLLPLSFDI